MIQETLHDLICSKASQIDNWFSEHKKNVDTPFYTSVDVRDSGNKIVSVDANIYPAGFNNICPTDKEASPEIVSKYIRHNYGSNIKNIAVLTEEHTQNPYYWENVSWIIQMLEGAGFVVKACLPRDLDSPRSIQKSSGGSVMLSDFKRVDRIIRDESGFIPDLIISNNDFSLPYNDWAEALEIPINPPRGLGWHQRKKSENFKHYNRLAIEFSEILGIDPWTLTLETQKYSEFDIGDRDSREKLAKEVGVLLSVIEKEYRSRKIDSKPSVFIKNNSGTYGLGVMKVDSPEEVLNLNSKERSKLSAAKGGRSITEVILQEGVPTIVKADGFSAEPVVYLIGCELAGGFFRAHSDKSDTESLNSPGAVYKKMCVTDLKMDQGGCPFENVYGWVAKLSSLAIGYEAKDLNIRIGNTNKKPGCA